MICYVKAKFPLETVNMLGFSEWLLSLQEWDLVLLMQHRNKNSDEINKESD